MEIKVKTVDGVSRDLPVYQSSGAAGFDFVADENAFLMPGETVLVKTGLCFEVPVGYEIQVRPRSGMSAKTKVRIANAPGTIDCDFRGEVKIILDNTGDLPVKVQKGDRIAQGVISKVEQATFTLVSDLSSTDRGNGGFGSTGK